jgi:carbamoyl-phosphate synthase small subunit
MRAILALEDGTVFHGESFGAAGEVAGEVIFNTSMTGYQEILTDPSYKGQIVTMTYPHIGNYGVNKTDVESAKPQVEGFVIRALSPVASSWRKEATLEEWLKAHGTVAIQGVDTRALTVLLREWGALKGILSTVDLDEKRLVRKAIDSPGLIGRDLVKEVTCPRAYPWPEEPPQGAGPAGAGSRRVFRVVAVDCGMKAHIPRMLTQAGCQVTVVPATATAREILEMKPGGLFLSNGPGDPEGMPYLVSAVRDCVGRLPIFGICLGHQILGLALGGKTYKLKFGHHGGNHPVIDLGTGRVEITAQNHGFSVDPDSIPGGAVEVTHRNLNDQTCEGMRHRRLPVFSVQYHPEASPGPHDSRHLFRRFVRMMETGVAP